MIRRSRPYPITPPSNSALTSLMVNDEVRGDGTTDATLLDRYAQAAVAHLDGFDGILGRCLITQTWGQKVNAWADEYLLPFPDVSAVTIKYVDESGSEQTVNSAQYEIVKRGRGDAVRFLDAFAEPDLDDDVDFPITLEVTAGYGAVPSAVPVDIIVAMTALVRWWYDGHDGQPPHMAMLDKYRWIGP